jgi:hypothetical protein
VFNSGKPAYRHTEEGIKGIGERKDNDRIKGE